MSLLLIALVGVSLLRARSILIDGRFWAEEGYNYWIGALEVGFPSYFWWTPEHAPYHDTSANVLVYLATLFPMRLGPLFTAWSSLVISLTPAALILFAPSRLVPFDRRGARWVLAVLVVLGPTATEPEIFASSIGLMPTLGFLACLIAFTRWEKVPRSGTAILYALIWISFLSGPYAAPSLGIFLWYAVRERKTEAQRRYMFPLLVALCPGLIQVISLVHHYSTRPVALASEGMEGNVVSYMMRALANTVIYPIFGRYANLWVAQQRAFVVVAIVVLAFSAILLLLILSGARRAKRETLVGRHITEEFETNLILGLIIFIQAIVFSVYAWVQGTVPFPVGRHSVTMSSLLVILLFRLALSAAHGPRRRLIYGLGSMLVVALCVRGALEDPLHQLDQPSGVPTWASQVSDFHSGRSCTFEFWPGGQRWETSHPHCS